MHPMVQRQWLGRRLRCQGKAFHAFWEYAAWRIYQRRILVRTAVPKKGMIMSVVSDMWAHLCVGAVGFPLIACFLF
jgi:hypothetical protein